MRLSWDVINMTYAKNIATRSYSQSLQVGALIVTSDNETDLAKGYNGNAKGEPNIPDSEEPGKSGWCHAEMNALTKMNYSDPRPRKMYLTHSPCPICARLIINAKIEKVIYLERYRDSLGLDILEKAGIIVEQMTDLGWE